MELRCRSRFFHCTYIHSKELVVFTAGDVNARSAALPYANKISRRRKALKIPSFRCWRYFLFVGIFFIESRGDIVLALRHPPLPAPCPKTFRHPHRRTRDDPVLRTPSSTCVSEYVLTILTMLSCSSTVRQQHGRIRRYTVESRRPVRRAVAGKHGGGMRPGKHAGVLHRVIPKHNNTMLE